jgi:hypothetical protein
LSCPSNILSAAGLGRPQGKADVELKGHQDLTGDVRVGRASALRVAGLRAPLLQPEQLALLRVSRTTTCGSES